MNVIIRSAFDFITFYNFITLIGVGLNIIILIFIDLFPDLSRKIYEINLILIHCKRFSNVNKVTKY